ncbi:hypothetical protein KAJ83_06715 [Marivibrio halodurans]|uniref:Uncharacterized protein n=1 Tax=Marivibrio halodurans TaxID=2039722 RepID=A0A8J7S133_9PROT|nr:hypothetical protein [Marivibrio halodurans]MBP5856693.1 hypothetical protein [Marivibrio halodurans]
MGKDSSSKGNDTVGGLAVIAGIICAIAGYGKGGWGGALVAGAMGSGAVYLAFKFIGLLWTWLVVSAVLLLMLAVLVSRWEALSGLFQ